MDTRKALKTIVLFLMGILFFTACNDPNPELGSKEDELMELATPTTFSYTTEGGGDEDEAKHEDIASCPPVKFRIAADHVFSWSPGRVTDLILIDGETIPGSSCVVSMRGVDVQRVPCKIPYFNSGYYQTDEDKCIHSGESHALLEVDASCEGENYVLEISEIQDPDAPIGGELNCPSVAQSMPQVTFYPPSLTTVSFPISEKAYQAMENGPDPSGSFEYVKRWDISVTAEDDAPCDEIKQLQLQVEFMQKRMELYEELADEATSAQDLDRRVQQAMDELFQGAADAGTIGGADPPTAGGHYDPCTDAEVRINYTCASGLFPPPLCEWIDEGLRAHEQAHQDDAVKNENNETWTYCHTEGSEEAQIASKWEAHAYSEQLKVYNEILDTMRDLYPECID